MHHFDKNDNNYRTDSDVSYFFCISNMNLLVVSSDFRIGDFHHCPLCVRKFQVYWYGFRFFFLIIENFFVLFVFYCDEHMHHIDTTDDNYQTDFSSFLLDYQAEYFAFHCRLHEYLKCIIVRLFLYAFEPLI